MCLQIFPDFLGISFGARWVYFLYCYMLCYYCYMPSNCHCNFYYMIHRYIFDIWYRTPILAMLYLTDDTGHRYLPCYIWHMILDTGTCHAIFDPWYRAPILAMLYLTHDIWHRYLPCYIWHMISDTDTCHAILDTWYPTPAILDTWYLKPVLDMLSLDTWYLTPDV